MKRGFEAGMVLLQKCYCSVVVISFLSGGTWHDHDSKFQGFGGIWNIVTDAKFNPLIIIIVIVMSIVTVFIMQQ